MKSRIPCLTVGCFALAIAVTADSIAPPNKAMWKAMKFALTGSGGDEYFKTGVKDALVPGAVVWQGYVIRKFSGNVVSWSSEEVPETLELGVTDARKADATLHFDQPFDIPLKLGMECRFEGVVTSYSKSPYMLHFNVTRSDVECR